MLAKTDPAYRENADKSFPFRSDQDWLCCTKNTTELYFLCSALGLLSPPAVNAESPRSVHHDLKIVLHPSERKLSGLDAVTIDPRNVSNLDSPSVSKQPPCTA